MNDTFKMKVLESQDVKKIHKATLEILGEVGVKIPHKDILNIFKKEGATVDFEKETVRMSEKFVEEILKKIIKNTKSYYQKYEKDSVSEEKRYDSILTIANIPYIIDIETGVRRNANLLDVLKAIVVSNNLGFKRVSAFVSPEGYNESVIPIIQHYLLFIYSKNRKFKNQVYHSIKTARCIIEMVEQVAENEIQRRNGTLVEFEMEPVANLEFSNNDLEVAMEFTAKKMKVLTTHWCWMGYHSPMTYASCFALANANNLAGMIILALLDPDILFFDYIFAVHSINKNNLEMPLFGGPQQAILAIGGKQIADYYGFQYYLATTNCSDSVENNFQSGFERGVNGALAVAGGVDNRGVRGIIGADQGASLEQLVIDKAMDDVYRFIFSKKVEVSDDTIDMKTIKSKGIGKIFFPPAGGNFNEYWLDSDIFVNDLYENAKKGKVIQNITSKIAGILKKEFPPKPVIDSSKIKKLDKIMESYVGAEVFKKFKSELDSVLKNNF